MKLRSLFKKINKEKKGASAIEIVAGMMMFLVIMSFMVDIAMLTWKFQIISQTNTYIARTVGIQGGLLVSMPDGFPGGNESYITYSEMESKVKNNMNKAGIEEYSFNVTPGEIDYGDSIDTRVVAEYKWQLTSNFIPGEITNDIKSDRTVFSEFKYRYDSFKGE